MPEDKNITKEELAESGKNLRRAYNLANFGTLTSLISTGAYFAEQRFLEAKKLPRRLVDLTIGAIGVGVASVLASYYFSLKAGRIALQGEERLSVERSKDIPSQIPAATEAASPDKWTEKCGRKKNETLQQSLG